MADSFETPAHSVGCFICRPDDPAFADTEGCPACEADFGKYVRDLIDAGLIDDTILHA